MKMNVARGNIFRNVTQRLAELGNEWLKGTTNSKQLEIQQNIIRNLNRMIRALTAFGNLAVIVLVVASKFRNEDSSVQYGNATVKSKHTHVFSAWIPLDENKHQSIIFIMHIIAGYCAYFGHFGNDFIVLAFMIFCIQQLRILSDQICRFRETALMRLDGEHMDLDVAMILEIKRCIRRHQNLIQ